MSGLFHAARMTVILLFGAVITACQPNNADKSVQAQMPETTGIIAPVGEQSLPVGELERWFHVIRADSVVQAAPLVIVLHGGTRSMADVAVKPGGAGWRTLAADKGFVLIAPNGTNPRTGDTHSGRQQWNDLRGPFRTGDSDADDVAFILALIDWAEDQHGIDKARVYITGGSNGGMMTYRMLIEAPEAFAAAAAFIANLPEANPLIHAPSQSVPLMIANGTADEIMPWAGGPVAKRRRGRVQSAKATRDWWLAVSKNGHEPVVVTSLPDTNPEDGCRMIQEDYAPRPGSSALRFIRMDGSGHSEPATQRKYPVQGMWANLLGPHCLDANAEIMAWDFFTSQLPAQ